MKQEALFDDAKFKYKGVSPKHSLGNGPKGKHCRDCANLRRKEYHDKVYYKCFLIGDTNGTGTDIRLKWPACFYFREEK